MSSVSSFEEQLQEASLEDRALDTLLELHRLENDGRPNSTLQCLGRDGRLDPELHAQFLAKEEELDAAERNNFQALIDQLEWEEEGRWKSGRPRKKARSGRRYKNLRPYYFDDNGRLKFHKPRETVWYTLCIVRTIGINRNSLNCLRNSVDDFECHIKVFATFWKK